MGYLSRISRECQTGNGHINFPIKAFHKLRKVVVVLKSQSYKRNIAILIIRDTLGEGFVTVSPNNTRGRERVNQYVT